MNLKFIISVCDGKSKVEKESFISLNAFLKKKNKKEHHENFVKQLTCKNKEKRKIRN